MIDFKSFIAAFLPIKKTITPEEIKEVQEKLNADPDPNNILIIYDADGNEMIDRVPLPAKFDKLFSEHTAKEMCELIDYCCNIMGQYPVLAYVDKDEKQETIDTLKSIWWPKIEKKLAVNSISELPDGCPFILLFKNEVEVHVY